MILVKRIKGKNPIHIPDNETIYQLANKYGIKARFVNEDTVYMTTSLDGNTVWDEWLCYIRNNKLELWHQNHRRNCGGWHHQNDYYDFPFMFRSMKKHGSFVLGCRGKIPSRLEKKFEAICN